jgi:hypothetical protein
MRVPDTIAAVIDATANAEAFAGVLVRWGLLPELPTNRERFYFLGASDYRRQPASNAHRVRTETFDIRGLVEIHQLGAAGPEAVVARAWELLDALDAVLSADPDFVHAEYTHELTVGADEVVPMTDGWLCRALFRIGMATVR